MADMRLQALKSPSSTIADRRPDRRAEESQRDINHSSQTCNLKQSLVLSAEQELLVVDHVPVVRFIARRIHRRLPQYVPIEDLYSAGVVGLLEALDKFVPSKQVEFRSYAQFRIRGAILDSLRDVDWGSRGIRRKGRNVDRAIQTLTSRFGRPPTDLEVAQELNTQLADYQRLVRELEGLQLSSLDPAEMIDVPARREDDPLFQFLHAELRERLVVAIGNLREQERHVLTLYYYEGLKQKEIGLIMSLGESRISQILSSAVAHLRGALAGLAPIP